MIVHCLMMIRYNVMITLHYVRMTVYYVMMILHYVVIINATSLCYGRGGGAVGKGVRLACGRFRVRISPATDLSH